MQSPGTQREDLAGPESGPEAPFPIYLRGPVIRGFGRGSKDLGIPTANIPTDGLSAYPDLVSGVYFGYTSLLHPPPPSSTPTITTPTSSSSSPSTTSGSSGSIATYPSVLSIGYNPQYGNTTRSVEIHILHSFASDFYGASLNLLILGFIRPEYKYDGVDSLIKDIRTDCRVAERSLKRENWTLRREWEAWLGDFAWARDLTGEEVKRVEDRVLGREA